MVTAFKVLKTRWQEVTKIFKSKASFDNFVEDWMSNQSAHDRKNLSYYGGLTMDSTKPNIPQAFSAEREHSPESVFFDPGNWTYMKGMQLISPELLKHHGWNQETVGDIWESFLGYRFLYQDQCDADKHLLNIAHWVDRYMNSVHTFVFLAAAFSDSFWVLSTNCSPLTIFGQWDIFVRHGVEGTLAARMTPAVEKTSGAQRGADSMKNRGDVGGFVKLGGDCTVDAQIASTVEENLCARVREAFEKHRADCTVAAQLSIPSVQEPFGAHLKKNTLCS